MERDYITIALAKGRLGEKTMDLLEQCGVDCSDVRDPGRKLEFFDHKGGYSFFLVKPSDVPTYVDHGVADIGVVGKDTLLEENRPLYEMLETGIGKCKLSVAGYPGAIEKRGAKTLRIATKYPNIAKRFYQNKGTTVEIIKLNGSVELGPVTGLSDVILDIVESGKTLEANGLQVLEDVCAVSARLVVNQVSLKTKSKRIKALIAALKECCEDR